MPRWNEPWGREWGAPRSENLANAHFMWAAAQHPRAGGSTPRESAALAAALALTYNRSFEAAACVGQSISGTANQGWKGAPRPSGSCCAGVPAPLGWQAKSTLWKKRCVPLNQVKEQPLQTDVTLKPLKADVTLRCETPQRRWQTLTP